MLCSRWLCLSVDIPSHAAHRPTPSFASAPFYAIVGKDHPDGTTVPGQPMHFKVALENVGGTILVYRGRCVAFLRRFHLRETVHTSPPSPECTSLRTLDLAVLRFAIFDTSTSLARTGTRSTISMIGTSGRHHQDSRKCWFASTTQNQS